MQLFDYKVVTKLPKLPLDEKAIINTINPHSYCLAKNDLEFKNSLKSSDFLLPDGIGIVWAIKILEGRHVNKIAGFDMFLHLLHHLEITNGSCFFLGSSNKTLDFIHNRIAKDFPSVSVDSFSPPYKNDFTIEDSTEMCLRINKFNPDVLFVGMTAPKQEKWVYRNRDFVNTKIICSIGAVFDFYAGTVKRPSEFWINLGLEWLPRFLKEPIRLAKRNLISTPNFIYDVFRHKYQKKSKF